jgi:DNA-binding NarL/FixJ family response regulator
MTAAPQLVEAAYRFDLTAPAHLAELGRAATHDFGPQGQVSLFTFEHSPDFEHTHQELFAVSRGDEQLNELARAMTAVMTPSQRVQTVQAAGLITATGFHGVEQVSDVYGRFGPINARFLLCPSGERSGVFIGNTLDVGTRFRESPAMARQLVLSARHVSHAWRLRLALEGDTATIDAVFTVDGRCADLNAGMSSSAQAHLRGLVLAREKARAGGADAAEVLPELLSGRWVLVDRWDADGRRHIVAYAGTRGIASPVTELEKRALLMACRGLPNKAIAIDLRVSQSAVTRMLERTLHLLGLANLQEAIHLMRQAPLQVMADGFALHAWSYATMPPSWHDRLAPAERVIIAEVLGGQARTDIARRRGVSEKTIDKQLARAYQKLDVADRRGLQVAATRGVA